MEVQDREIRRHKGAAFVGRVRELNELRSAMDQALVGGGRLYMLAGEPGIGKTRLADEAANYGAAKGARPLWGRCWEGGGAPAYWPWIQIVRGLASNSSRSSLAEWMGAGAAEIAQIVPELRGLVAELPERLSSALAEPEQARFRLFDSTVSFLRRAADAQPLVIVLDDLHGADPTSLLMLTALARDLRGVRLLAIGTYREVEVRRSAKLAELVAEVEREGVRLPLRGLGEAEIGQFIEFAAGIAPTPPLISLLGKTTDGNPFYMSEILRLLAAEGQLKSGVAPAPRHLRIPDGVRESIKRRTAPLGEKAREILATASVIGREFDLACLERASETPADALAGCLDEAASLELIREAEEAPGRYRFCHALIRETLYDALPTAKRVKLHRLVGDAIRSTYPAELHCAELAYHYSEAAPGGEAGIAVHYARQAAQLAKTQLAYEEAARHLRRALAVMALAPPGNEGLRAELLLELGEAQNKAGDLVEGRKTCLQAVDLASPLKQPELFARAVVEAGRRLSDSGTTDHALVTLLKEALTRLGDSDSPVQAQVMARLGVELYWCEPREDSTALCQRAVEIARRLNDQRALILTLWARHLSRRNPDGLEQRLADAAELIRIAEQAGEKDFALEARFYRIADLLELGDITGAEVEHRLYTEAEAELRDPLKRSQLLAGMRALLDGRFREAESLAQQAFVAGQQTRRPQALHSFLIQTGLVLWEQGRLSQFEPTLRGFIAQYPAIVFARCGLVQCLMQGGREAEARSEVEALAANDFSAVPRDWNWLPSMCVLADACADLRDTNHATKLYRLLLPYSSRNAVLGYVACYGSVSYLLGKLAATLGQPDEAQGHFEVALAADRRIRAPAWVAHTQYDYAALLLDRARGDDRQKAGGLIASAQRTAQALGMVRLEEKLSRLATEAGVAQPVTAAVGSAEPAQTIDEREAGPPEATQKPAVAAFRKEGEYWTIGFESSQFRLRDAKGLAYIALLLRNPGREFSSVELAAGLEGQGGGSAREADGDFEARVPSVDSVSGSLGDAGEMLDSVAKVAYKRRLAELREQLEDAREIGNAERAAQIEEEIDALARELARAVGLGGRDRKANSHVERARIKVTTATKKAIRKISEHDPRLGRCLATTIKTGIFCSFSPDPASAITWEF